MSAGVQNGEAANEAAAVFEERKRSAAASQRELNETRRDLEGTRSEPHDDAPATATTDGGQLEAVEGEADAPDADVDDGAAYTMSIDRRIGSTHLDVEYHAPGEEDAREHRFKFGKPNGYSSRALFAPIEEAEENEDQSVQEMTDYIWGTLAEWCVEENAPGVDHSPQSPEFWGSRMGLGDAITTLQNLAIGIDPNA